jgi:hypothetical protein
LRPGLATGLPLSRMTGRRAPSLRTPVTFCLY